MEITTKDIRSATASLDGIIKYYKEIYNPPEKRKNRDWRTYEQQLNQRMSLAAAEIKGLVHRAAEGIVVEKNSNRGRKPKLGAEEKTLLLLIQQIFNITNRKMSAFLFFFALMTGISVSYKTVERAYSDPIVQMILHNMFALMVNEKKIQDIDISGDGTGYALTIKKQYRDSKDTTKDRKDFVYAVHLLNIDTCMYVGFGFSRKSEKEAYDKARTMLKSIGITVKSARLDRYYSSEKTMDDFGEDTVFYLIPKKNATVHGCLKWKKTLGRFAGDTYSYLREYFKRTLSESMISMDKRFTGGYVRQRISERIETCLFARDVIHNLVWMYG